MTQVDVMFTQTKECDFAPVIRQRITKILSESLSISPNNLQINLWPCDLEHSSVGGVLLCNLAASSICALCCSVFIYLDTEISLGQKQTIGAGVSNILNSIGFSLPEIRVSLYDSSDKVHAISDDVSSCTFS